ncbi:glycosyltransferase family 4 protein [soil metagenome]
MFSWRDTANPEGGGAEIYLERMAVGLRDRGATVAIFCAAYDGGARDEIRDGIRYVRRGSPITVYLWGLWLLLSRQFGRIDQIVDVQNGLPFFTRLVTRKPVRVLVHHVHREQWQVVYPGWRGRLGWWLESVAAPRVYRRDRYITVSNATRGELCDVGVDPDRIDIVHNGTDVAIGSGDRTQHPSICAVSRLVPHKRIEFAIDAVADLRAEMPDLTLTVAGSGWWQDALHQHAVARGVTDLVDFAGWVDEKTKADIYARSWVMAMPSLKEGWGLVVSEASAHGTPVVAFRSAGGTTESVADQESGLLVDDYREFVAGLRDILTDDVFRKELSEGALERSGEFSWTRSQERFSALLGGQR